MRVSVFSRHVLGICAALALAACGVLRQAQDDTQPPIGAPGVVPQRVPIATHAGHGPSWMLPEAKHEDLLYVSGGNSTVTVYSYKTRKLVGTLTGIGGPYGLCSNVYGDVFVVDYASGNIYEYRHGDTKVINTLSSGGWSFSCAVDPTTGDLAVTNGGILGAGNLVVFKQARGKPIAYSGGGFLVDFYWCAYDNDGNLFVDGVDGISEPTGELMELHKHAKSLTDIPLNLGDYSGPGAVLWDGRFLAFEGEIGKYGFAQLKIEKNQWTLHGNGVYLGDAYLCCEFAIVPAYGGKHRVLIEAGNDDSGSHWVGYWNYPSGGQPFAKVTDGITEAAVGITVSTVR